MEYVLYAVYFGLGAASGYSLIRSYLNNRIAGMKDYMTRVHYPTAGADKQKYAAPVVFKDLPKRICEVDNEGDQMNIGQASQSTKIILTELSHHSNEDIIAICDNYRGSRHPKPY